MEQSTSTIRTWLEETADRLMQNANATVTLPRGVRELKVEQNIEPIPVDVGVSFYTSAPGPSYITFIAELENGTTIETVRS